MKTSDITRNDILLAIENNDLSVGDLVSILILTTDKLVIDTYSGMANIEDKTTDGIRKSNKYFKLNIGRAKLAIKDKSNSNLPF